MKRKFSFNLAPIKIVPKTDAVTSSAQAHLPSPEPTPTPSTAHSDKTHASRGSICDNSPYIRRRPLDAHTEQELRLACRTILQNFKPSDHGMENTDPKLDFGLLQRQTGTESYPSEVKVRVPTGAPQPLNTSTSLRRTKTRTRAKADLEIKARAQHSDLPVRANSTRRRTDFAWLDERDDKRGEKLKTYGKASMDVPRPAVQPSDSNEDIPLPVTVASTLAHPKLASTAPTSSAVPSRGDSKARSRQENPTAVADAQTAELARDELEQKSQDDASHSKTTAARPLTRSKSIKENIKGYVFSSSRSRALSRAQSKESLRSPGGSEDHDLQRNGSWRKWAMPRMPGSKSRPGTSSGPTDETNQPRRSESEQVNLNRDLPPLPGLDQWKELEKEKATMPKSPIAATHIASLMRPQEQAPEHSSTVYRKYSDSGLEGLAMQNVHAFPPRGSSRNQHGISISSQRAPLAIPSIATTMPSSWSSSHIDRRPQPPSTTHTRQRSGDSMPTTIGTISLEAASASRKMSVDSSLQAISQEVKPTKKEEQKSRLKKVFSGWMTKKEKKGEDWIHKLEKESGNESVLVQDGSVPSTVVRY